MTPRDPRTGLLLAALTLVAAYACRGGGSPPGAPPGLTRDARTGQFLERPDDEFAEIADRVPGFAGCISAGDTLVLMLVDPAQRAAAEAAVRHLRGDDVRHVAVRRAQYDFRQLRDWKHRVRGSPPAGWTMTDADEAKNRLVVGVRDSAFFASARRTLRGLGIPSDAVILVVAVFEDLQNTGHGESPANVSLQLTAPVTHPGATPAGVGERSVMVPRLRACSAAAELGR